MIRSPRTRKSADLPESLHQRLNLYILAAGAAGVGMLAHPAEAKIVYTPADVPIVLGGYYNLDLSHDGITDFTIVDLQRIFRHQPCQRQPELYRVLAVPNQGNGIDGSGVLAKALTKGAVIGPGADFYYASATLAEHAYGSIFFRTHCIHDSNSNGNWVNVTDRYLGLTFQIRGKTHYGWARLSVGKFHAHSGFSGILTGYAYETIVGKSIVAGKTNGTDEEDFNPDTSLTSPLPVKPQLASLGALALGSLGLSICRREESVLPLV